MSEEILLVLDPKAGNPTELKVGGEVGLPGPIGPPGVGGELVTDDYVVTATDIANKGITLPKEVYSATGFFLSVFMGNQQRNGVDYLIQDGGTFLDWDGLALEGLLEEGDVIHFRYIFVWP